jgi:methyl-accepting chemotaxis protein
MSIRMRLMSMGAIAGASGAAVSLAAFTTLGRTLGGGLGLLGAAAIGAVALRIGTNLIGHRVVDYLALIDDPNRSPANPLPELPPLAWGELDDAIDSVRTALVRAQRLQADSEAVDRLAKSFLRTVQDASSPNRPATAQAGISGLLEGLGIIAALLIRDSGAIEVVNERMATGAVDQSETVTRTTTTVEDLSDKIDRISQHAEDAAEACQKSRQEASRGLEQLHSVIEGMDRLRGQVEANGRKARRLGDRSVEIGTIVELIRGISNRTDMLALNATIESVRAGEHGRGFAVVAEEIRKLAERTAGAAREIGTLVDAIQTDTQESIRAMGEEQTQMEQEAQRVREAGTALERISEVAESSARLVEGISRSSNDQVLATQELVIAMQRISEVSHRTIEGTTQARALIRELSQSCAPFQEMLRNSPPPRGAGTGTAEKAIAPMFPSRKTNRRVRSEQPA